MACHASASFIPLSTESALRKLRYLAQGTLPAAGHWCPLYLLLAAPPSLQGLGELEKRLRESREPWNEYDFTEDQELLLYCDMSTLLGEWATSNIPPALEM